MLVTFEREGGSIRGEDDFFSVARTIPLVAIIKGSMLATDCYNGRAKMPGTFDTKGCYTLVYSIQGIF